MAAGIHRLFAWELGNQPTTPPAEAFGWECARAIGFNRDRPVDLQSEVFAGTYQGAIAWLKENATKLKAAVFIFSRSEGMEEFFAEVRPLLTHIPSAGGAAARANGAAHGRVVPSSEDVIILGITEGKWESQPVLFHRPNGTKVVCAGNSKRSFVSVLCSGEKHDAITWFESQFSAWCATDSPWEKVALLDGEGRLLHMHVAGGSVAVSADLPAGREVEVALFDEAFGGEQLAEKIGSRSLVFGCAGLNAVLSDIRPWEKVAPTTYLYGEVVHLRSGPAFANLSFSLLNRVA